MHEMFQGSYDKLDGSIKSRVLNFMVKLQQDPDNTGLDFKQPKGAANKYVRTARVNDNYRAVLIDPGGSGSLYLVAVMKHDDAYEFAGKLTIQVNPRTGAAELFDRDALGLAVDSANGDDTGRRATPFMPAGVRITDLERFGIETAVAEQLLRVEGEDAFLRIADALPSTQGGAVLDLAFGKSPDEVWNDYAIEDLAMVDQDDLAAALERPISRLAFTAAAGDNEDELRAVLEGDFAKWRVWLHPLQRDLAEHDGWNGPFRVTGGAGTGKTVTALHRARHLARRPAEDSRGKVLLTTYTRNLVRAIESQLIELAGKEITRDVDVVNVDALARRVVASTDEGRTLLSSSTLVQDDDRRVAALWSAAASDGKGEWEPGFLADEWSLVVLGNSIETETEYLRVPRSGRSQRLSRPQRVDVWRVVEHFQRLMRAEGLITFTELAARAAAALNADRALVGGFGYRHAVVDEAQDLHPAHWKMLRSLVPPGKDDLFIVGDAHQRLYGRPTPLSRYGIETRGRSRRLTINYRTSREILRWTLHVADPDVDDLDLEADTLEGARSVFGGPEPSTRRFATHAKEDEGIGDTVKSWQSEGLAPSEIAVFAHESRHVAEIAEALAGMGIPSVVVGSDTAVERMGGNVRVMTMHRAKGLEFRGVVLARMGENDFPPSYLAKKRGEAHARELSKLRSLLYVAGSRAREQMLVAHTGRMTELLG
ncbi:UvrD-helicase domain-containing protein [Tsukamurella tyrosinosolvens]|nr:UvrD-helicase domain-containing protein [Tsukamurella tyrosinosolvens]